MRSLISVAFVLASLPLCGCSSGDDDSTGNDTKVSAWAGHTYTLTTTNRDWAEPKGFGKDIENVMPIFIFQLKDAGGGNLTATLATAQKILDANNVANGVVMQDPCGPTMDIPVAGGSYPSSQIGPVDATLHLVNRGDAADPADDVQVTALVKGLQFKDILPNGDTKSTTGELKATMDFRELAPLFTALGTPGMPAMAADICAQLGSDNPCLACSDGAPYCMSARAVLIGAEKRDDVTVTPVTLASRPATCGTAN
jgi:hypothetical protein